MLWPPIPTCNNAPSPKVGFTSSNPHAPTSKTYTTAPGEATIRTVHSVVYKQPLEQYNIAPKQYDVYSND